MVTVLPGPVPSCVLRCDRRSRRAMVKQSHLPFIEAARAKRVERTAVRRQNAIPFTCERSAPKGQGAHPAQRAGRGTNVMATLTLALVRCYGLFCRAFPGHAADSRHQLSPPHAIATVLPSSEPRPSTCRSEIATVLWVIAPDPRPSWRAEPLRLDGQRRALALSTSRRAKRVELTTVRRQNAIPFTCERSAPKEQGAHPAHRAGRGSNVMATFILALVRCYGLFCRALPGHAADPRHQLTMQRDRERFIATNTRTIHSPRRDRERFAT